MFIGEVMQQTSEYGRKLIAGLSGEVGGVEYSTPVRDSGMRCFIVCKGRDYLCFFLHFIFI